MPKLQPQLVSFHGGHSGEFCDHAADLLEDIIKAYIEKGFSHVGISEHIPPLEDRFLFPEEVEAGRTISSMQERFGRYMKELRRLAHVYESEIKIYTGMETEVWPGYEKQIKELIQLYQPDYMVGSVHHVEEISFDFSPETYQTAAQKCGSISGMYARYFDLQYEMIQTLRPFVVGHFDLIRIYDPSYRERIKEPDIQKRIHRNLDLIKSLGLVMDLNLRPLAKGKDEPYPTQSILEKIQKAGIPMLPGDDSHGADQAGCHVSQGIELLCSMQFDTNWIFPCKPAKRKIQ